MSARWILFVLAAAAACGGDGVGDAGARTWARDIAPIVYESCAPCHRPGETAPFALLGYDDVRKRQKQILRVVEDRLMPPWLPDHGDFVDDRRLGAARIELLRRWIEDGAPRGDPATEPPPPQFRAGWQLGEPDLVVTAADEVVVAAEGVDAFRNLVIPLELEAVRYVAAVEIRPGSPAVHHAVLAVDATREARRLDGLDPGPGFLGMLIGNAAPPDGHFLGWTPGKRVHPSPPGMAFRLWPGNDLVLQLHLTATGKEERVRPRIGLWFTDVPTSAVTFPLVMFCDDIDIAAGVADYVVADHFVTPVPVAVHSIYPHAHYLCRRMRAWITPPGGEAHDLFRIDRWDFDWQDDYRFREPVVLPAGTRIDFEYRFDNSDANPQNPSRPPRRVRFGQQSADEMATLTLQLLVPDLAARRLLAEASLRRDLDKVGYDANLLCRLCGLLREMGRNEQALVTIAEVRTREPENAQAMSEQGMCLVAAGRLAEAEQLLADALRRDPGQNTARMHLGSLLARSGRTAPAIALFEDALRLDPANPALLNNLATALFAEGQLDRAEACYRRCLELDAGHFGAWFNLGRVQAALGKSADARRALQRALELRPGEPVVEQELQALDRK